MQRVRKEMERPWSPLINNWLQEDNQRPFHQLLGFTSITYRPCPASHDGTYHVSITFPHPSCFILKLTGCSMTFKVTTNCWEKETAQHMQKLMNSVNTTRKLNNCHLKSFARYFYSNNSSSDTIECFFQGNQLVNILKASKLYICTQHVFLSSGRSRRPRPFTWRPHQRASVQPLVEWLQEHKEELQHGHRAAWTTRKSHDGRQAEPSSPGQQTSGPSSNTSSLPAATSSQQAQRRLGARSLVDWFQDKVRSRRHNHVCPCPGCSCSSALCTLCAPRPGATRP